MFAIDISPYGKATEPDGIEESHKTDGDRLGGREQIKAKGVGKGGRETVERGNRPESVGWTSIPSEALRPAQTPMRALRSGHRWRELHRGGRRIGSGGAFHSDGLAPDSLEPGAPDATAWPVFPEDGSQRKHFRYCSLRR